MFSSHTNSLLIALFCMHKTPSMACLSFLFRRIKSRSQVDHGDHDVQAYTYKELRNATNDFCTANKVGQGGFGSVYRGKLKDGTVVAVKVLSSESKQGQREFLNELDVISNVVHQNLVQLRGCCIEGDHRILVYNYLENSSLAQTLLGGGGHHSNIKFSWRTRAKMCIGIARGLAFLHETVQPHVVHRDIKASNILLDKDLNPKISDFGLAKLIPADKTHVSTRVAGTVGYLAPEYAIRGQLTRRADTYSFGVLLLEIVTGRSNANTVLPADDDDRFLLERSSDITHGILLLQTWMMFARENLLSMMDASLNGEFDAEEACRFLKVGLLCTQDAPRQRPIMSEVVKMLTGRKEVNTDNITKPGVISDFMELKIRCQKCNEAKSISNPLLSARSTNPFSSLTTKSDHYE